MPNGKTHMLVGAGVGIAVALVDKKKALATHNFFTGSLVGAFAGKLPDVIEPALNPNHRQFFHSLTFLAAVSAAWVKAYKWTPDSNLEKIIRCILLIGGASYMSHLVCDATTPKGLPVIGKL
jgi:membrane-bound metal-dependent hydrolase YbcI (DUF457 family)